MPIENRKKEKKDTQKVLKTNSSCSPLASERRHSSPSITGGPAASLTTSLPVMATPLLDDLTSVCVWVRIRRAFQYRSVCGRARGSRAAPGQARARARVGARPRARRPRLASARSAPDKLASTPGTLRTTAGGGPRACQSALPPPLCPTHKHSRGAERTFIHRFLGGGWGGGLALTKRSNVENADNTESETDNVWGRLVVLSCFSLTPVLPQCLFFFLQFPPQLKHTASNETAPSSDRIHNNTSHLNTTWQITHWSRLPQTTVVLWLASLNCSTSRLTPQITLSQTRRTNTEAQAKATDWEATRPTSKAPATTVAARRHKCKSTTGQKLSKERRTHWDVNVAHDKLERTFDGACSWHTVQRACGLRNQAGFAKTVSWKKDTPVRQIEYVEIVI